MNDSTYAMCFEGTSAALARLNAMWTTSTEHGNHASIACIVHTGIAARELQALLSKYRIDIDLHVSFM